MGSAGIAQLVEQLICNQQVVGSNPTAGSMVIKNQPKRIVVLNGRIAGFEFEDFVLFLSRTSTPVDQSADHNESECSANDL